MCCCWPRVVLSRRVASVGRANGPDCLTLGTRSPDSAEPTAARTKLPTADPLPPRQPRPGSCRKQNRAEGFRRGAAPADKRTWPGTRPTPARCSTLAISRTRTAPGGSRRRLPQGHRRRPKAVRGSSGARVCCWRTRLSGTMPGSNCSRQRCWSRRRPTPQPRPKPSGRWRSWTAPAIRRRPGMLWFPRSGLARRPRRTCY